MRSDDCLFNGECVKFISYEGVMVTGGLSMVLLGVG